MTVTVVSAASYGGEVNEGRVWDTRGECPDGWRKRDGLFYYFERRRHLVVGGRETNWLARGKFRDRPTNEHHANSHSRDYFSDLFCHLSLIRLPSVLRILRRRVLRRAQAPHPKIFPIVAFHESPTSPSAIRPQ